MNRNPAAFTVVIVFLMAVALFTDGQAKSLACLGLTVAFFLRLIEVFD